MTTRRIDTATRKRESSHFPNRNTVSCFTQSNLGNRIEAGASSAVRRPARHGPRGYTGGREERAAVRDRQPPADPRAHRGAGAGGALRGVRADDLPRHGQPVRERRAGGRGGRRGRRVRDRGGVPHRPQLPDRGGAGGPHGDAGRVRRGAQEPPARALARQARGARGAEEADATLAGPAAGRGPRCERSAGGRRGDPGAGGPRRRLRRRRSSVTLTPWGGRSADSQVVELLREAVAARQPGLARLPGPAGRGHRAGGRAVLDGARRARSGTSTPGAGCAAHSGCSGSRGSSRPARSRRSSTRGCGRRCPSRSCGRPTSRSSTSSWRSARRGCRGLAEALDHAAVHDGGRRVGPGLVPLARGRVARELRAVAGSRGRGARAGRASRGGARGRDRGRDVEPAAAGNPDTPCQGWPGILHDPWRIP